MIKKILIFSGVVALVGFLTYAGIGVWQLTQVQYAMAGYKIKGFRNTGSKTTVNPFTDDIITVIKTISTARFFDFDIMLNIKNVSYLSVSLIKCNLAVSVQGIPVCLFKDATSIESGDTSTIPIPMPIVIEKNSVSLLTLPISIDMKKASKLFDTSDPNSFINLAAQKKYDKINISLQGDFTGSLMKIHAGSPISINMTFQDIINAMNK